MIKPTIEAMLAMTNEQLYAMTDVEIDAYMAEALKIRQAVVERNIFKRKNSGGHIDMGSSAGKRKNMMPTSDIADKLMKGEDKMKYLEEMKAKLMRGESIV